MQCPKCNTFVPEENRFCPACGHNLKKPKTAPAKPPKAPRAPRRQKKPATPPNPTNQILWVILGVGILLLAGMITLLALLPKVQG